jgi:hypothetical protein
MYTMINIYAVMSIIFKVGHDGPVLHPWRNASRKITVVKVSFKVYACYITMQTSYIPHFLFFIIFGWCFRCSRCVGALNCWAVVGMGHPNGTCLAFTQ